MTGSDTPTVVVGVPVRNGGAYLADCLASLCDQTRPPDTIVVSDNASDDDTVAVAERFRRHHPDLRIRRRLRNVGASANFNELVTTTDSTYFAWMAHDDRWEPQLLERALVALDGDAGIAVAHGEPTWIDPAGDPAGRPVRPIWSDSPDPVTRIAELLADDVATHLHDCNAAMGVMRRSALERTRLVQSFPGADKTLIFELALQGRITELSGVHFLRRRHPASSVVAHPDADDRQRWFDPRRTRPATPVVDLVGSYLSAVARADHLGAAERVRIAALVARWSLSRRRFRVMAGELRRRALSRPSPATSE
ncbi:MAG: glycosyltransferase [Deltaproteobacteria bacterium]|nr:MAG: glycosyltransferase [Deltaproteobacteria bacterium]